MGVVKSSNITRSTAQKIKRKIARKIARKTNRRNHLHRVNLPSRGTVMRHSQRSTFSLVFSQVVFLLALLALLALQCPHLYAQQSTPNGVASSDSKSAMNSGVESGRDSTSDGKIEQSFEQYMQENGTSAEADELDDLARRPLHLRSISMARLLSFPGMTALLAGRIKSGANNSLWSGVPAMCDSLGITEPLRSFLCIGTTLGTASAAAHGNNSIQGFYRLRMMQMLETTEGQREGIMLGSPADITQRIRVFTPWLDAGAVAAKDAHEASLHDFVSGFVRLRLLSGTSDSPALQCILGDFLVDEGLGSMCSRSTRQSKGSNTTAPVMRTGAGILPSTGTLALRTYRGAALQLEQPLAKGFARAWAAYSLFYRRAKQDSLTGMITALDLSDAHRTLREVTSFTGVHERSLLGGCELQWDALRVGATYMQRAYTKPIAIDDGGVPRLPHGNYSSVFGQCRVMSMSGDVNENNDVPENDLRTSGQSMRSNSRKSSRQNWEHHCALLRGRADIIMNAEFISDSAAHAALVATLIMNTESADIVLRARRAHRGPDIPMGSSFTEFGSLQNEEGLYAALHVRSRRGMQWWFFADVFRSILPRSFMPCPTRGLELFAEMLYSINAASSLRLRGSHRVRTESERSATDVLLSYTEATSGARVVLEHRCSEALRMSIRADAVARTHLQRFATNYGSAISAGMDWRVSSLLRVHARSTLASTNGFSTAVYVAEVAAPGSMRLVPLYDDVLRSTCTVEFRPMDRITLWIRYEHTQKNSTSSMGSSITATSGGRQRVVFLQTDVQL